MNAKPAYFEVIRDRAAKRWEQLDGDPELAAPWWQLFKQVQSPRHIVSELLQNADDSGATEATVAIEDGCFVFSHNGEDFTEEHFASLCSFGHSNKRALHTIGFRGIGFKSTFSLGERVELLTPSLSIGFDQKRFTEPFWVNDGAAPRDQTTVRVRISDEHRQKEVEKNLKEWLKSPISLLFFRYIRRIRINDKEVHWGSFGPGPIPQTEWLALHENPDEKFLLARSGQEHFPEDALREIHQERMLSAEQDVSFPPCQIEIVVGVEGRLFVVLPTGVKTTLPFACNAPFIQDPARLKIKDPETSPTNHWLLKRVGKLAAEVMLEWLRQSDLQLDERARAYALLPDVDREDTSLEGTCGTIVEKAFEVDATHEKEFLLTEDGKLVEQEKSIIIPKPILDVWPAEQAAALFDDGDRPAFSQRVLDKDRKKLLNWGVIKEVGDQDLLNVLQEKHLPQPAAWHQMLVLWACLNRLIQSYNYNCNEAELRIVPVQGKNILFAASEVIRLGEKRMVPSDEDWAFLSDRLSVLNQNWMRFLTKQRRNAETQKDKALRKLIDSAYNMLDAIGLDQPSDTGKVIDQVAETFFSDHSVKLQSAIRLTQIAAKLGTRIQSHFKYVCQDKKLRPISETVVFDEDGSLSLLLPDDWADKHVLHVDYVKHFNSCTREEWESWTDSGRAGLAGFVPLEKSTHYYRIRKDIDAELARRSFSGRFAPRYSNPSFRLTDWDFDEKIWTHWEGLEADMPSVWGHIAERVLSKPSQWTDFLTAKVKALASNGYEETIIRDGLLPRWLSELRERACLRDTNGEYRKPVELLMRSHETEALMGVEPFVHKRLDSESTRPLLKLLGVSDKPTDPEKILTRLKVLAQTEAPPAHEVEKWYKLLDQLIDGCSTEAFMEIRELFETERLILTETGTWESSSGAFLSSGEEDVPNVPLVLPAVRNLTFWRKVGVGDRPTAELAIKWLNNLPSGCALQSDDLRRTKTLLEKYPAKVWSDCGHWLSLAGNWTPIDEFDYALTMQSLTRWRHLHPWVKQKTCDFQSLPTELCGTEPFSALPPLATIIEERFEKHLRPQGQSEVRPWLQELGRQLCRIKLDDGDETDRVQRLASTLSRTLWVVSDGIEIVPYINGKPAGTPRKADVLWLGDTLYAEDKPLAKIARGVAQEIGKAFSRSDIIDAIKLCFDREPEFVRTYFEENFELIPEDDLSQAQFEGDLDEVESPEEPPTTSENESHDNPTDARDEGTSESNLDDLEPVSGSLKPSAGEVTEEDDKVIYRSVKPRYPKLLLIERFALAQGFKKDNDDHYFNEGGQTLGKTNGSLFPWELREVSGNVTKHIWPKEHCLEREPLQLGAEIWGALERKPESYVLVLVDPEGEPIEVSGKKLTELRDRGVLALHPSTYRLVIEHEKQL